MHQQHMRLPVHFHLTSGLGQKVCAICFCWWVSIGFLERTRLYAPFAPHLLVHFHLTSGLGQIICTICICVCWCIFIGFLDWTRLYAPLALHLLGHFHWISGLGQIICTICTAFAGAFPLDFWTGPDMHHMPLRLQVHSHGNSGLDRSVRWCIFSGFINWTGLYAPSAFACAGAPSMYGIGLCCIFCIFALFGSSSGTINHSTLAVFVGLDILCNNGSIVGAFMDCMSNVVQDSATRDMLLESQLVASCSTSSNATFFGGLLGR
jgi:hypothetical protein